MKVRLLAKNLDFYDYGQRRKIYTTICSQRSFFVQSLQNREFCNSISTATHLDRGHEPFSSSGNDQVEVGEGRAQETAKDS
jgi:hypothetical protein